MTSQQEALFTVVKGNPSEADSQAIESALRALAFTASTDAMPQVTTALNNWGDINKQFDTVQSYAPTAYSNL